MSSSQTALRIPNQRPGRKDPQTIVRTVRNGDLGATALPLHPRLRPSAQHPSMAGTEGIPGSIQITATSYELIKDGFVCEPRGPIEVKGKATMQTYLLLSRRDTATRTDRGSGARSRYIE